MIHVTDNAFSLGLIEAAVVTWPCPSWQRWHCYNDCNAAKYATKDPYSITPPCRILLDQMAALDCPPHCFPDLDLHGAGMHWMREGGFLGLHQDGEKHPLTGWYRKWNAILFLSETTGGELKVEGHSPIKPAPGRLVQFDSNIPHQVLPVISGERMSLSIFWWSLTGEGESCQARFESPEALLRDSAGDYVAPDIAPEVGLQPPYPW